MHLVDGWVARKLLFLFEVVSEKEGGCLKFIRIILISKKSTV
jgi:hypothetical protein